MRPDGSQVERLTDSRGEDWAVAWSPDAQQLVFASRRDGGDVEIYTMNADGSNPQRVTYHPGLDAFPVWTPEGIFFVADRDNDVDIYKIHPDSGDLTRVTYTALDESYLHWSPDADRLIFGSSHSFRAESWDIYSMNPDGSQIQRLTYTLNTDNFPAAAWVMEKPWRGSVMIPLGVVILMSMNFCRARKSV